MKTTSVALFLALSAGYLGAANAESLNNNATHTNQKTITSNQDTDTDTESEERSRLAVSSKATR